MTDFAYVNFHCPACGADLQFSRECRWGQDSHGVNCMSEVLGGYSTCTQGFHIATRGGKTYVTTSPGNRPVTATLSDQYRNVRGISPT